MLKIFIYNFTINSKSLPILIEDYFNILFINKDKNANPLGATSPVDSFLPYREDGINSSKACTDFFGIFQHRPIRKAFTCPEFKI